jgi:hypothetical protein
MSERFVLYDTLDELKTSVRDGCHFCTILWQVIGRDRLGTDLSNDEVSRLEITEIVL